MIRFEPILYDNKIAIRKSWLDCGVVGGYFFVVYVSKNYQNRSRSQINTGNAILYTSNASPK